MSEFPHDTFAKDYLTELLNTIGKANPNKLIRSERREGDLWFERDPRVSIATQRQRLGLLGQLLTHDSLIEVFRNPATEFEIRACKGKLIGIEADLLREATRREETLVVETLPHLWLIMPTASEAIRHGFGFRKTRIAGVYRSPKFDRTGLIVVHQLAITEESLWLRVLGKEGNQNRAIQELVGQPTPSALYASIEEILADYRTNLESRSPLTLDEEDLIMNLSAAYLKKREEWKEEGKLEGKLEGKTETAINLLRQGFSAEVIAEATGLSIETIANLRDQSSL
jgi:hypothetical protein